MKTFHKKEVNTAANILPVETNTAAACVLLATAQVADSLMARGSTDDDADAPASLRVTCIVLIACAASPPIREYTAFVQRGVATFLLSLVAMLADHHNGLIARVADGACAMGLVLLLLLFFTIGPMPITSKQATHCVNRDVFCALPAALMVHVGSRVVRTAFAHPWDTQEVRVGAEGGEQLEVGYAFASTESCAVLAFGGAIVVGTGVMLLSSNSVKDSGSAASASAMLVSAGMQIASAFAAMLGTAEQVSSLPALFGASACDDRATCNAAFESRRNVLVTTGSSVLWLSALSTIMVAFAPSLRFSRHLEKGGAPYAIGSLGFAVWRLFVHLPFEGDGSAIEWCCLVALVAVTVSTYMNAWLGMVLFTGALCYDLFDGYLRFGIQASSFQPTDAFISFNLGMLMAYLLVAATYDMIQGGISERVTRFLDATLSSIAALGTSSAFMLYVLSASSTAAASGALFTDAMFREHSENRFFRAAVRFVIMHYLPLLVWLVPYADACAAAGLGKTTGLHFVGGLLPVFLWGGVAIYADASPDSEETNAYVPYLADTSGLVLGIFCAAVASLATAVSCIR